MTYPSDAGDHRRGATPAQLRAEIDSGRTGERSAGCDPAAAPLAVDWAGESGPPEPRLRPAESQDE